MSLAMKGRLNPRFPPHASTIISIERGESATTRSESSLIASQSPPKPNPDPRSSSQLLREKLSFRFRSVRESFQRFDANVSGFIEDHELRDMSE